MLKDVVDASVKLNKMILKSEEYQKFCLYKKELARNPELRKKVQEFREKNHEIGMSGPEGMLEAKNQVVEEYRTTLDNPLVASYLNSELVLCRMMQDVLKNLTRDLDLDLDFI